MRVLLLYPPISMRERYSSAIGNSGGRQVPLGVFALAASLRRHGHEVRVVDGEATGATADEIAGQAAAFAPALVGISATAVAFHRARELAGSLRERLPRSRIVVGGPHPSACLSHAVGFPEFDGAVFGEGEATLLELVEGLERDGELPLVPGAAVRSGGEVRAGPPRAQIPDLDSLPFAAYDLIPDLAAYNPPPCNYQQLPVASLVTSRGCPNACTFCDQSVFGRTFRQRSPEHVAAEIEWLVREHGVRELYRRFYLRPRVAWRYACSFVSATGLRRLGALGRFLPFLLPGRSDGARGGHGG